MGCVLYKASACAENIVCAVFSHIWDIYITSSPRLKDHWWRGDGKLRAGGWRGLEWKCLPDMTWCLPALGSHISCVCLNQTYTRSRPSTFQNGGERGSWTPTPNWGAVDSWWLLGRGRVRFLSGCVSLWVNHTPGGWLHAHQCMDSMMWTW